MQVIRTETGRVWVSDLERGGEVGVCLRVCFLLQLLGHTMSSVSNRTQIQASLSKKRYLFALETGVGIACYRDSKM